MQARRFRLIKRVNLVDDERESDVKERMTDYDYIIAGAGLSGLALATSLIDLKTNKRVALIDCRTDYRRDHIWSCWNETGSDLQLPFDHVWCAWKVKNDSKTSVCRSARYPYSTIFAESYYRQALDKIQRSDSVDLFLGEHIKDFRCSADSVSVQTEKRKITAHLMFDSRPPEIKPTELQQDFFGIVIRSINKNFDPACLTLMDFAKKKAKTYGFHFFYVLPFSEQEALVESVFVGFERMPVSEHRKHIIEYLSREFGIKTFEEGHIEHGAIPMHSITEEKSHERHYLIGTRGGLVRASSGYGFASIHRFSKQLASSLQNQELPKLPQTYSNKAKVLDAVLLTFLKKRADLAPRIFSALFASVKPDVLIRFLCDASSPEDDAKVFAAMPNKFELGLIMAKLTLNPFSDDSPSY